MNPLETYLKELSEIRSTGAAVKEVSYYGKLETLLNEIGKTLKPKVKCIINLQNQGAGLPDGGLFTQDQSVIMSPGRRSSRVGEWRIISRIIEAEQTLYVAAVCPRGKAYSSLPKE